MTTQSDLLEHVSGRLITILSDAGDEARAALASLLYQRLIFPQAYVTVVGETSSGKSSLINTMLSQPLLPVSARPTTGVVTHVACRDQVNPQFFAIYRDATQESLPYERFSSLSLEPGEGILRLQLRARPASPDHVGLHIFDTPGYNAMLSRHEEVLMSFLPQSDVIVFVVGHRTGFGQTDQDLFEAVAAATAHDKNIPLVLVINRAPAGCGDQDRRVLEIKRLAEDGLRRSMLLQIVPTANLPSTTGPLHRGVVNAQGLWSLVRSLAFDPDRLQTVRAKLKQETVKLLDDADASAERLEAELMAGEAERTEIQAQIGITHEARADSIREIDATIQRLQSLLPELLRGLVEDASNRVDSEISSSDKWLGSVDCAEWIANHCLPYEVRGIGRAIEDHISTELEALNQRLEEIANTAISELDQRVAMRGDDPVKRFTSSLAVTLGQRLAGNAVNSMLRGLGGVGGVAAGTGNLAKMAVSRAGKLFGKQFGRGVYDQIGRVFSKKMLERLNVIVTIIIEVGTFVYEASVWQGKLKQRCDEALNEWRKSVIKELLEEQIPSIRKANYQIIEDLYETEFSDHSRSNDEHELHLNEIRRLRYNLEELRTQISTTS